MMKWYFLLYLCFLCFLFRPYVSVELFDFGAVLLFITEACCTVPIFIFSACFLCTSIHCLPESMSCGCSPYFSLLWLWSLFSASDWSRLRDRCLRCLRWDLPDRPEPRDISLSLSDMRLLREWCLLPERESFEDWLSTELERWRWPVLAFREDADLTDFGLLVMPNRPRCWLFAHPALLVLRGESGAEYLLLLLLLLLNVAGMLCVDR